MTTTKKMKNSVVSVVDDAIYGIYVWLMPDGSIVGDDDGNYLNVESLKDDRRKIDALTSAVKSYGVTTGKAYFMSGRRRVTDSEHSEMVDRSRAGLEPDPFDPGIIADEMEYLRQYGN